MSTKIIEPIAIEAPSRRRRVVTLLAVIARIWLLWPATHGGRLGLVLVHGNSMQPTYAPDDLVLIWAGTIEPGRAVLLRVPDGGPLAGRLVIRSS